MQEKQMNIEDYLVAITGNIILVSSPISVTKARIFSMPKLNTANHPANKNTNKSWWGKTIILQPTAVVSKATIHLFLPTSTTCICSIRTEIYL